MPRLLWPFICVNGDVSCKRKQKKLLTVVPAYICQDYYVQLYMLMGM